MGYSYQLAARVLLYALSHRQDSTYHNLCCTSRSVSHHQQVYSYKARIEPRLTTYQVPLYHWTTFGLPDNKDDVGVDGIIIIKVALIIEMTIITWDYKWIIESNVLFKDASIHVVTAHRNEKRNLLLPLYRLFFPINSKESLYEPSHKQDSTFHSLSAPSMEHWLEHEIVQWVHQGGLISWPTAPRAPPTICTIF